MIHGTLLDADQGHPAPAVTPIVSLVPPAGAFALLPDSEIVQPLPWLRVKVWPPIVSVADRAVLVVDDALYWTVPFPLPLEPAVTVSHDALLVVVHGQPGPAVTPTPPVPPLDGTLALVGEIETEHPLP